MRDLVLYGHLLLGLALIVFSALIVSNLGRRTSWVKPLSAVTAFISWILLLPSGILYLSFYPATKTVVKAGAWPWAHSIIMETKEHWGILLPVIATTAAFLVFKEKEAESKKWWTLVMIVSILLAVMGRVIKMGASA